MAKSRSTICSLFCALLAFSACEDQTLDNGTQSLGGRTLGGGSGAPGSIKPNPGLSFPFPEVIETEYIPRGERNRSVKCRAWRITWPAYSMDYNAAFIPTVLSVNNGELNSINFLNKTNEQNTYNGTLSLYTDQKVKSADTMWPELIYTEGMFLGGVMETVVFAPGDISLNEVMTLVQESPASFETLWPENAAINYELPYQQGDFFYMWLSLQDLYGGVRIVSVSPRIIEVYLAVPNN